MDVFILIAKIGVHCCSKFVGKTINSKAYDIQRQRRQTSVEYGKGLV
jgi:hypothetical protein